MAITVCAIAGAGVASGDADAAGGVISAAGVGLTVAACVPVGAAPNAEDPAATQIVISIAPLRSCLTLGASSALQ